MTYPGVTAASSITTPTVLLPARTAAAVTSSADDPIRADVERVLHAVIDATVRGPARLVTAVPRCVLRRAAAFGPLAEPARVVRSIVDLVAAGGQRGVIDVDDAPAPDEPAAARPSADRAPVGDPATDLPIDDYESLAASHVVDRLPSLTPDELRTIRAFEVGNRGRRTILGRIDQLLA